MNTPKISLCIISRKEDKESLINAIESCSDYVYEIIVIDTSPDCGLTLPTEWLNKKAKLIPFGWIDDFSAARNFSFEQASGDVIFWIDSDDVVKNPENLPKLASLISEGQADWIYSEYHYAHDEYGNLTATHWKPRLFRKGTVKWEKTVHEDAVPLTGVIQVKDIDTGEKPIVVVHNPETDVTAHMERNLGIMMAEFAKDGDKTDPRTLQYLAFCLEGMEQYSEAIPFYNRHIVATGSNSDKYWSLIKLSRCLAKIGDTKNAISVCMDSLKLFPQWKASYFKLAELYYDLGEWEKVVEWTLTGAEKETPDVLDVINPLDYYALPYGRLSEAYLMLNLPKEALESASILLKNAPTLPLAKEIYDTCKEAVGLENYVRAFLTVAKNFRDYDRVKTKALFDLIPAELDDDIRIQQIRSVYVPPTVWGEKDIVIYCGDSLEEWAFPSIYTGIGGSETAVIQMSEHLAQKGYSVTVYNRCGSLKGEYNGVIYKPYYHFNPKDVFNVLISWRTPGLFLEKITAKKKYLWLHDILYPEMINAQIIENVDKILFLSKWHSENVPGIPKEKIFITNNGINPNDFKSLPNKRPNSLIWSSSYDRGLVPFMENIWPLIKKEIPDTTLDIAYGTQNLEKEMDQFPTLREVYDKCQSIFLVPGVTHHGRISHKKLTNLMGECMVYPYASEFGETCNITSMMCQAASCYVITTSQAGGTPERVKFGKVIEGNSIYTDKKLQKEFAKEIVEYLKNPKTNTKGLSDFYWESTTKQWINEIL